MWSQKYQKQMWKSVIINSLKVEKILLKNDTGHAELDS